MVYIRKPAGSSGTSNTTYKRPTTTNPVTGPKGQGGTAGGATNADYPFYTYQGSNNYEHPSSFGVIPAGPVTDPAGGLPTGGSSYGGGGGGSTTPGLDQGSFDSMLDMIRGTRPYRYDHTSLDLPEYDGPGFYDWDPSMFGTARNAVNTEIDAGLQSGNRTYEDARYELNQYQNPYGNVRTTNPGVRDAMSRMMQANGVDPDINAQVDWEGQQADDAFGYTQALMSGTADQQQAGNLRALGGDQRRFTERLGGERRQFNTNIDMAMAQAKARYEENRLLFDERTAKYMHDQEVAKIMANNQGVNSANQANIGAANSWNQGAMDSLIELILAGRDSKGKQGLNLTAIPGMTQWEMNR